MRLVRFNDLTITEKATVVRAYGTYLMSLVDERYVTSLFVIHSYFVELCFNWRCERMEWIVQAEYVDLDKYLDHIEIPLPFSDGPSDHSRKSL